MRLYLRLCAALLAAGALTAAAGKQPWTLEASNWEQGKDLLPGPVVKRLQKGEYWCKVVSADPSKFRHNYSQAFWDATEKNAGRYDLDQKTCGLKDKATDKIPDFVFGLPFPQFDKADPKAGCKIAWNFAMAGAQGGGGGATFTLNGVDTGGQFRRIKAFIHTRGYQGRHFGPIKENPEGLSGETIGGALEPVDVEGVSTLTKRYWNWDGQDAVWAYVPSTRRARRVNAASRSDPVAGLDIFADDLNCYAGKVEYYQWKLVGEQTILAPLLQPYPFPMRSVSPTRQLIDTPYMPAGYEVPNAKGAPWWIQQNLLFVPRPVWVVEGQSSDPFYNVVGRLRNTSGHALRYVKLRIEALDEHGKVVARTETYNESAEALAVPDLNPEELLKSGKVKSLPAHAEERFRGSFLKEETPPFTDYRVKVIETPAAREP